MRPMHLGLALTALLLANCLGPKDTGFPCETDSDCGTNLICETMPGGSGGQCTLRCSRSYECENDIGPGTFCIGAGYCVRHCTRKKDKCPERTSCNPDHDWCVRR